MKESWARRQNNRNYPIWREKNIDKKKTEYEACKTKRKGLTH